MRDSAATPPNLPRLHHTRENLLSDISADCDNLCLGRLPPVMLNSTITHRCSWGRAPHQKNAFTVNLACQPSKRLLPTT